MAGFLLMIPGVQLRAQQDKKIVIRFEAQDLPQSLKQLQQASGVIFAFDEQQLKPFSHGPLQFNNESLQKILTRLLQETGYDFAMVNGSMIISKKKQAVTPPKKAAGKLTGKVIDEENGEVVNGVTVRVDNKATITDIDGTFQIPLPQGRYTAVISYIGYGTKEITEIIIKDNETFSLPVTLKREKGQLSGVVVKASARNESVASLYVRQKNATTITDGISAEQISRTPDNNLGQVLKRVSGVSTIDTRYVVVRGMTERYNQAMLDGVVIPSTDMNRRNFSFDVVPQELVSNVVVNKTASPDQSAEFSGGQILINTLDIPQENFTSFTVGAGFNTRTTGKDFTQLGGRGKYDYLGFDDGRRKTPTDLKTWTQRSGDPTPSYALEQSKRFSSDQLKAHTYTATPNQNYRFSLGRLYQLKAGLQAGFSGGLTYRNTQETNPFETIRQSGLYIGNDADYIDSASVRGTGNLYKFNTTLGGVLNAGIQGEKFKLTLKNYYSHVFNEVTQDASRYEQDNSRRFLEILSVPEITTVFQNKLEGEHRLNKKGLQFNWSGALTHISQEILDMRRLRYDKTASVAGKDYYQKPAALVVGDNSGAYDFRLSTHLKERDYNWGLSLSQPFQFLHNKSTIKAGYTGWQKHRSLGSAEVRMIAPGTASQLSGLYENIMAPGRMGISGDSAFYYADASRNGTQYDGTAKYHSAYLMFDQRFFRKLRAVYGVRAENFNLQNSQEQFIRTPDGGMFTNSKVDPFITGEKNWRFLPSLNLTYSLNEKMNLRAAYATTVVRPDFRETSYFELFDTYLEAYISGWNVVSTQIRNYDLRYEWYPGTGEVISVSAFYKYFDKPLELVDQNVTGGSGKTRYLRFQNQDKATSKGFEAEIRKSLGFIADKKWLRYTTLYGNGTWMQSEVTAVSYRVITQDNGTSFSLLKEIVPGVKRALYGQSPWILNAGINYNAPHFGANLGYNRSGYRSYVTAALPAQIEYENGRNLLDLQLSTRLLRQKAEIKLNISNLLDEVTLFYTNPKAYGFAQPGNLDNAPTTYERINGTDGYEKDKGDRASYRIKNGRTVNITFTYKF
jgi:outer membrane receptor protein involved in Fe transport